jgi:hypothetical protein
VHQLDPDMLAAVLVGPSVMLEGYEPEKLLPAIACPVLLVQADPRFGNALSDHDVALGLRLLRNVTHVRVDGLGHPLHAIQPARMAELFQAFLTGCKRGAGKFGNGFLRAVIVDERFAGGGRGNECGDDGKLKPLRRGDHQALRIADAQARRPPGCVI